jgi:xanthine dehydrogenase small subunit
MINFILNQQTMHTDLPVGSVVLDFLRKSQRLAGVKESCREGDCGACLILIGEWDGCTVSYQSMNSCLLPIGEIEGRHVVTIEGLTVRGDGGLNPIQQVIVEEGATQCGYCTPGIILALTGLFLNKLNFGEEEAIAAVSGNICRCTGYQSIKRAIMRLCSIFPPSDTEEGSNPMYRLVEKRILPNYFLQIPERLQKLSALGESSVAMPPRNTIIGGGTDLWVQRPKKLYEVDFTRLSRKKVLKGVWIENGYCHIGSATSFQGIESAPIIQDFFPGIREYFKLIASKPIRHRATIGGNIVNASPIGDLSIFFLALDSSLRLNHEGNRREIALKEFFLGYKKLNRKENELVEVVSFPVPTGDSLFNFEKVSKRIHMDIASVNSAIQITLNDGIMVRVHLSAGGVTPIPLYLSGATGYLMGRKPDVESVRKAASIAQSEISPISDMRGSAEYKRLLLRQLIYSHFITLFPGKITLEALR